MYSEARKLNLIEKVLQVKSDAILTEIEAIMKKKGRTKKVEKASAHDFLGMISEEDVSKIDAAVKEGCEKVNPDEWK